MQLCFSVAALFLTCSALSTTLPVTISYTEIVADECVSFRQTGDCSATGPPEPSGDKACDVVIPCNVGACPSGYCECRSGAHDHPVDCHPESHGPFKCADFCQMSASPTHALPTDKGLEISNGFVRVVLNLNQSTIHAVYGDFAGQGDFRLSVLASAFRLEREDGDGSIHSTSALAQLKVLTNTTELAVLTLAGITDNPTDAAASETWTISLSRASRSFVLNTTGSLVRDVSARAVRHSVGFASTSIYALFERGVVQMLGADKAKTHFAGALAPRVYAMGGGTSVDIRQTLSSAQTVVISNGYGTPSGLQEVLAGALSLADEWTDGWSHTSADTLKAGTRWTTSVRLAPNNRNFPAGDLTTDANLDDRDLEAYMTGIYGSPVGCLCTYDNEVKAGVRVAQIATTIARPDRGYGGTYNYFDPDNFIGLSAMIYSNNPYLQDQARLVIERSGAFLKPNGQLPHHFKEDVPQYLALSGETQTGPNIFWTKTALQYASASGDLAWLVNYMPSLRAAASFCFDLIDPDWHMIDAPGSLMIDVFVRANFTADSNAMMIGFLRQFAEAEYVVGNATGGDKLNSLADTMRDAMNALLWDDKGDDHFLTQRNRDNTTRDFVDYDANLIAIAHSVPPSDRAKRILERVDSGRCSHASGAGPQFVSERWYGPADTTGGNTGDSWCSMGRIAWFDAHARKLQNDQASFDSSLALIQGDLLRDTWMHERYGCDGKQQDNRTSHYFEYPSTVAILLREIRYGINLGLRSVTINPFGPSQFNFHIGNVDVDYSPKNVRAAVPGSGTRQWTITGLVAAHPFDVSSAGTCSMDPVVVSTDAGGVLSFVAPIGVGCVLSVAAQ